MPESPLIPAVATQLPQPVKLNVLDVHIESASNIFFRGEAKALSFINEQGPFDVLPEHENFISLVKEKVVVYTKDGTKKEIALERAIIKITNNVVHVFLGI